MVLPSVPVTPIKVSFLEGKPLMREKKMLLGKCQKRFFAFCRYFFAEDDNIVGSFDYNKCGIREAISNQSGAAVVSPQGEVCGFSRVTIRENWGF